MDVFGLRESLVRDYDAYVKGFLRIRNDRIRTLVHEELDRGLLWPEPLVQVNPAYQPGATVEQLSSEGILHRSCGRIFRTRSTSGKKDESVHLHEHQEDAIRLALGPGPRVTAAFFRDSPRPGGSQMVFIRFSDPPVAC